MTQFLPERIVQLLGEILDATLAQNQAGGTNNPSTTPTATDTIWTDDSGAFYVRTGPDTYTDVDGTPATPGDGLRPASSAEFVFVETRYDVLTAGTGYGVDDVILRIDVLDSGIPPDLLATIWINTDTRLAITPVEGHLQESSLTTALLLQAIRDRLPALLRNGRLAVESRPVVANNVPTWSVTAQTTQVALMTARTARLGVIIVNHSNSKMVIMFRAGVTANLYAIPLEPGDVYQMKEWIYLGAIYALWIPDEGVTLSGWALVTEAY